MRGHFPLKCECLYRRWMVASIIYFYKCWYGAPLVELSIFQLVACEGVNRKGGHSGTRICWVTYTRVVHGLPDPTQPPGPSDPWTTLTYTRCTQSHPRICSLESPTTRTRRSTREGQWYFGLGDRVIRVIIQMDPRTESFGSRFLFPCMDDESGHSAHCSCDQRWWIGSFGSLFICPWMKDRVIRVNWILSWSDRSDRLRGMERWDRRFDKIRSPNKMYVNSKLFF